MVLLTCLARWYLPVTVSLGLVILCAQPIAADSAKDAELSALLKKQTEEFSQAGQTGDVAVFDRYLDPEVVFPPMRPKRHCDQERSSGKLCSSLLCQRR